jgi:hypothetical protein
VAESRKPRKTAAVKARLICEAQEQLEKAQRFANFFGLEYTRPANVQKLADEWQAEIEAENTRKAEKAEREQKKALKEAKKNIALWRAGESVRLPLLIPDMARIEGEELVTNKGARVPLKFVRRIAPRVKRLIASGKGWKTNGEKITVAPYQLDEITPEGEVIAGCHKFDKAEVFRILAMFPTI